MWCDFHARSRFARSTIPEEKWRTTRSLRMTQLIACTRNLVTRPPTLNGSGGEGRWVWILLFSEVTLFEYNVSTILLPIVDIPEMEHVFRRFTAGLELWKGGPFFPLENVYIYKFS